MSKENLKKLMKTWRAAEIHRVYGFLLWKLRRRRSPDTFSRATTSLAKSPLVSPLSSFSKSFLNPEIGQKNILSIEKTLEWRCQALNQDKHVVSAAHVVGRRYWCAEAALSTGYSKSPWALPHLFPDPTQTQNKGVKPVQGATSLC